MRSDKRRMRCDKGANSGLDEWRVYNVRSMGNAVSYMRRRKQAHDGMPGLDPAKERVVGCRGRREHRLALPYSGL